jgi:tetratricopeptide (TPR) repeat protein
MSEMTETKLKDLLREGATAARVGEREAAVAAFRRATELAPESEAAWLGLAGAVEGLDEKRACFERVLAINPRNAEARDGLAWVARKEGENPSAGARPISAPAAQPEGEVLTCAFHPSVETGLRCNKCGKPICVRCARRTPVGYRCPECIRSQQAVFYSAGWLDYALVIVVGLITSVIGAAIVGSLGIWLAIFLGPAAGGIIAEAARWAARRRRGRYMEWIVSGCIAVGALFVLPFVGVGLYGLGGLAIYVATAIGTAYARLR